MRAVRIGIAALGASLIGMAGVVSMGSAQSVAADSAGQNLSAWPRRAPPRVDAALEARIAAIVAGMTLEQKVGQMTQAEIRSITPDQVRTHHIGSILNGGGAWPAMNKHASPAEWAALSDQFYRASMSTTMTTQVPIIWGIDAVHGNNNVYGATLFPHNIGLGAAHDPALIRRIGQSTARTVRATGITWAFAPTLAVVQNERWGRSYESFSSDPALVRSYAEHYVRGLQGTLGGANSVLATAKHFIGDGGTTGGDDQGNAQVSERELIRTHAQGYYGALAANVQTVMISYSSWNDTASGHDFGKMHRNRYLITDVLKGRMGFDGLVVSDWDAIEQVPGCAKSHCPEAINAGIDLIMVPEQWEAFIANTVADVREGRIAMSRIDDAVSRIIRVKLRSGLFDHNPAAQAAQIPSSAIADAALAEEAVRKSLVLLKNDAVLPLARSARVLVVGKGADNMSIQSGGWSRTWQGTENSNADFATGETLLSAIRDVVGAGNVTYSETAMGVDVSRFDVVIAVIGEQPYAEMRGDVDFPVSMAHSARYPEDRAVLDAVTGRGPKVVTILYSGRTLYANDLINRSDAFVAAWLPGTEASGVADVLFRPVAGRRGYGFSGTLSFAWAGTPCDADGRAALFPRGYGLRYGQRRRVARLPEGDTAATCN